ncbi:MAG TPA: nucleoside deaminase [Longimicrobiales bacterium]|nr:nucleoside deaminase [Longimicrobiales bacterium]
MIEIQTGTPAVTLALPDWLARVQIRIEDDEARVRFVLDLARRNMDEGGGPFAAAIFDEDGSLLAAGANLVVPGGSSLLHAEIVAILAAQSRAGHYSLRPGGQRTLVSSCDPCAMCLGAIHWAGLARLVTGAATGDARAAGFDEGPVDDASFAYLANRGMAVRRGVLRAEGAALLQDYAAAGGAIYNG